MFNLAWITAPRWIPAVLYLLLGWSAIVALPDLVAVMRLPTVLCLIVGGVAYSAGAVVVRDTATGSGAGDLRLSRSVSRADDYCRGLPLLRGRERRVAFIMMDLRR